MTRYERKHSGSRRAVLCIGLLAVFSAGCGNSMKITTADQLIAAHVQAIGGMEALQAVHSRTTFGIYEEGGSRHRHRFDEARPNLIRVTTNYDRETGSYGYSEGFDGAAWEYSFGVVKRVTGMPATALRHAAEFDPHFIDYRAKGRTAEFMGRVKLLDREVYQLRVGESDYFFDADSFLLVMQRMVVPFHGEGKEEEIITVYSDFRPVAGVLMAYSTVHQKVSGEIMSRFTTTEIQANEEIPLEWFAPPLTEAQQRFQQFRAQALEGDTGTLVQSYGDYANQSELEQNQEWENELNTLGYELISHERYDRAIAVFKIALARFPGSANLYDSLGEAYALAGNTGLAIVSYRRSLELDPDNDHAAGMIEELGR